MDKEFSSLENYIENQLKIYVPDGHLETGGVKSIFKCTRLPYPKEVYVVEVEKEKLEKLGYKTGKLNGISIIKRRPHNIPESLKINKGIGITGHDFFREKLKIDFSKYRNDGYEKRLNEESLVFLLNLECRPSYLIAAFPGHHSIRDESVLKTMSENKILSYIIGGLIEYGFALEFPKPIKEVYFELASEYKFCTEDIMRNMNIKNIRVIKTEGKTESYPIVGESDGIVDVVESGKTIIEHGLKGIISNLLERQRSTPEVIAHKDSYEEYPEFVNEFVRRLEEGKEKLMKEKPDLFKSKLEENVFFRFS